MKTIINEEIKRIQELMGFQKPLINEAAIPPKWYTYIDGLLRGTAKTDNFYTNIARFGGKTANELEAALKRGEDILTALGKSENEFAAFVENNSSIFKKFADKFLKTSDDVIDIEEGYMKALSELTTKTKDGIDIELRKMMADARRKNKLGEMAVLQKMYNNLDNISTKLTTKTIGKLYNSVEGFITNSIVSTNFRRSPKATKDAYKKFCETYWDSIKDLKSEKEVIDFMRNEAGILTTQAEKTRFDKLIDNIFKGSPLAVGFKVAGLAGGVFVAAVGVITMVWSLCSWLACVTKNRGKQENPAVYCSTLYFWGTVESVVSGSDGTGEGGEGQSNDAGENKDADPIKTPERNNSEVEQSSDNSPLYSGDEKGFKEWCRDNGYSGCYFSTELGNFIDDELNIYTYDKDKGIYQPKKQ